MAGARLLFRLIKYPVGEDEGLSERIIEAIAQCQVVENFAIVMRSPDLGVESLASVVSLLTLVAGQDEVKAFYVCRVLREEMRCILSMCTDQPGHESSYLHSVLAVLLCRLASIDVCLSSFLQVDEGTATLSQVLDVSTDVLGRVLFVPREKAASISSHDRHCFGLYVTLLVYITNSEVSDSRPRQSPSYLFRTTIFVRPWSLKSRSRWTRKGTLVSWFSY